MSTNKMDIAGEGTSANFQNKKNLSRRARLGKLTVEKMHCPKCNHHKKFSGNIDNDGQNINKCCRCKYEY